MLNSNADGANFFILNPHSRKLRDTRGLEPAGCQGAYGALFQIVDKAAQAPGPAINAHDGINHKLTGKVTGNTAAPGTADNFHASLLKIGAPEWKFLFSAVSAKGDHRGMLQKEKPLVLSLRNTL